MKTNIPTGLVFATAAMLMIGSHVSAQTNCEALLKYGTFDSNFTGNDAAAANFARSKYCKSGSNKSETGFGIGIPIEKIPVEINFSDQGSSSWNICDEKQSSSEAWSKFMTWSRTASPILAQEFVKCVKAPDKVLIWSDRSTVTNAFTITAVMHSEKAALKPIKAKIGFTPSNNVKSCNPVTKTEMTKGVIFKEKNTFSVTCQLVNSSIGVQIGLTAENGAFDTSQLSVPPALTRPLLLTAATTSSKYGVEIPQPGDATYGYGPDLLVNEYIGPDVLAVTQRRSASWTLDGAPTGTYDVYITYASKESRPLELSIDGEVQLRNVAALPTGSAGLPKNEDYFTANAKSFPAGQVSIRRTGAVLSLITKPGTKGDFPHVRELRLVQIVK